MIKKILFTLSFSSIFAQVVERPKNAILFVDIDENKLLVVRALNEKFLPLMDEERCKGSYIFSNAYFEKRHMISEKASSIIVKLACKYNAIAIMSAKIYASFEYDITQEVMDMLDEEYLTADGCFSNILDIIS